MTKIGRNVPCPCGSGKKYKVCCMNSSRPAEIEKKVTPQFRFTAGSYGDIGQICALEKRGLIEKVPGQSRTIHVLLPPEKLQY